VWKGSRPKDGLFESLCHSVSQCLFSLTSHLQPRQGLRAKLKGQPYDCLLVQVDAFFPDGHPIGGNSPFEENDGWRCIDTTGAPNVYSLEDLPAGFIEKLRDDDSGNAHLSISSATKINGNGQSNGLTDASSTSNNGKSTIKVNPGATVKISRGNKNKNRDLQERRKLAQAHPGNPEGDHTLLAVRVIDIDFKAPTQTATQLSDDIFGRDGDPNGDPHNLVSKSCLLLLFCDGTSAMGLMAHDSVTRADVPSQPTNTNTYIPFPHNRSPNTLLARVTSCDLFQPRKAMAFVTLLITASPLWAVSWSCAYLIHFSTQLAEQSRVG